MRFFLRLISGQEPLPDSRIIGIWDTENFGGQNGFEEVFQELEFFVGGWNMPDFTAN